MDNHQLTHEIIGAAIEVHRLLGPGLLESAYEECLCHELKLHNLSVQRQVPVPVVYKDVKLECGYRLDLVVENKVVLELKSIEAFSPVHEAVTAHIPTPLRLSNWIADQLQCVNLEGRNQAVRIRTKTLRKKLTQRALRTQRSQRRGRVNAGKED